MGTNKGSSFFVVKLIILISSAIAFSGCLPTKSTVTVNLKKNSLNQPLNVTVSNIKFIDNQIIVTGTNLNTVSNFKIKEGATQRVLQIESQTSTSLVANTISNVTFAVGKVFDFILSNAHANSTFTVDFSLCDTTLGGKNIACLVAPTDKQVLSYDLNSQTWRPRSVNGLSYKGVWSSLPALPAAGALVPGDYFIVSVANGVYNVGDWIVLNDDGVTFEQIENSVQVKTVFGRNADVVAAENDYQLDLLGDVDLSGGAMLGDALIFNGTHWVAGAVSGGGGGGGGAPSGAAGGDLAGTYPNPTIGSNKITDTHIANGAISQTKINGLATSLSGKEPTITAAATTTYFRGDKTFATLDTSVVPEGSNLYFTNARALGILLAGFDNTLTGQVSAADSMLQGFGRLQNQINSLNVDGSNYLVKNGSDTISGTVSVTNVITATGAGDIVVNSVPLTMTSAVNKTYADGKLDKTTGGTVTGVVTLDNDLKIKSGSNYVTIKGNAATAGDYNFVLPTSAGTAGYILSTDGNGNTSWVVDSSGGAPTGAATGDLGGSYPAPTVDTVGGVTAANVAAGANLANAATNANTANTIVKRDASGNFTAGTITATLNGTATNVSGTVAVANGGTGATTAAGARTNLGLGTAAVANTGSSINQLPLLGANATAGSMCTFDLTLGFICNTAIPTGDATTANPLSQFAATTSAQLAGVLSDETGSGLAVFNTAPTFLTNLTAPLIIGGSSSTSTLTYKTTSGVGAAGADHIFQVGNNGATEAMRILNNGNVGVGTNSPGSRLDIDGAQTMRGMAAPAVSPAGQGRIYFDSTANQYKVSQNGGAYSNLINLSSTPAGPNSSIQYNNAGIMSGSSNLAYNSATNSTEVNGYLRIINGISGNTLGDGFHIDLQSLDARLINREGDIIFSPSSIQTMVIAPSKVVIGSTSALTNLDTDDRGIIIHNAYNIAGADAVTRYTTPTSGQAVADGFDVGISQTGNVAFLNQREAAPLAFLTSNSERMRLDSSGNLGIGTITPGAKLEVAGQIKITGGTPGAGKILTSDASGLATWQTPSGGGTVTGVTATAPVVSSGGTAPVISMAAATTSVPGYLTAADWTTFNAKAPLASPTFTGVPLAPTAAANTNTTQLATTAFVVGQAGTANPLMNSTVAVGTSLLYSRQDHVHPVDTSRAPAAGSGSITTLGTITAGVWNATTIDLANGGTGATTAAGARTNLGLGTAAVANTGSSINQLPLLGANATVGSMCTFDLTLGFICNTAIPTGNATTANPLSQFAATTSAQLAGVLSDETGSGLAVFNTAPTFTTSLTAPLIIGGTGTASALRYKTTSGVGSAGADHIFQVGNNGATEAMRILNSGNVGLGTTIPGSKLEVVSTSTMLPGNGIISRNNSGTTLGAGMVTYRSRGTPVAPTAVANSDDVSNIYAFVHDGSSYITPGSFGFTVNGAVSGGIVPTDFIIRTGSSAGGSERVRVSSSGNVGIATASPSTALDVNGAFSLRGMAAPTVSAAGQGRIYFDSTANKYKVSQNGGAYADLLSSGTGDFKSDGTVSMVGQLKAVTGAGVSYSFDGDTDTGMRRPFANAIEFVTGGTAAAAFNEIQQLYFYNFGSASSPNLVFGGNTTGIWSSGTNTLNFSTNGWERFRIDPTGQVGVGVTSPQAKFHVGNQSAGASGESVNLLVDDVPNASGSSQKIIGIKSYIYPNSSSMSGQEVFLVDASYSSGASANVGTVKGYYSDISTYGSTFVHGLDSKLTLNGSGATALAIGSDISLDVRNTTTDTYGFKSNIWSNGSGNITNAYGIHSVIDKAGTITNAYGVYIGTVAGTNKYSLYSSDATAPSYFAGKVGIGTTAYTYTLQVNGSVAGTSAYQTVSDMRFKKDIKTIDSALEKLLALEGVFYSFRTDEFPDRNFSKRKEMGLIAQKVEKVFPEAITKDERGFRSVAYSMLIAPIIEAIKTLNKKIESIFIVQENQKREIASTALVNSKQDEKISRLEKENRNLKSTNDSMKAYLCQKDPKAPFCR